MVSISNKRGHTSDATGKGSPEKKPKTTEMHCTILEFNDINDDCLLQIASYLPPMDLINLSETCSHLKSMVEDIFEKKNKKFSGTFTEATSVQAEHLPIVLQKMGPFIRSIHWRQIGERQFEDVSKYCRNVNKLTLVLATLNYENIDAEKQFFKNIWSLCLVNCSSLDDSSLSLIIRSSKLKHLRLLGCENINGNFFHDWENCRLSTLSILDNASARSIFFNICETGQLCTLKSLSLDCRELATVDEIEKIRSLKNLRRLTLRNVDNEMVSMLCSTLHGCTPKIIDLKIRTTDENANLTLISDIVSSFANLKKFSYSSMSWELLQKICDVREIGKLPLIEIEISPVMFKDSKRIEFAASNKHLMKLTLGMD